VVTRAPEYARAELLAWVRSNAPDLRIGKAMVDGARMCFCRFTVAGQIVELEASGDDPDEQIVKDAAEAMAAALGIDPILTQPRSRVLERQVMAAVAAGQTEQADALTRELTMTNAQAPRALNGRIRMSTREVW
jgi:hypothetical protein